MDQDCESKMRAESEAAAETVVIGGRPRPFPVDPSPSRGVVIGDVPSYRVDNMPYGGVKDSGLGREGVVFAMEDMTEIRNLVIRADPAAIPLVG
jgi:hypothetical protein